VQRSGTLLAFYRAKYVYIAFPKDVRSWVFVVVWVVVMRRHCRYSESGAEAGALPEAVKKATTGSGATSPFYLCIRVASAMYIEKMPSLRAMKPEGVREAMRVTKTEHFRAVWDGLIRADPWFRFFAQRERDSYPTLSLNTLASLHVSRPTCARVTTVLRRVSLNTLASLHVSRPTCA